MFYHQVSVCSGLFMIIWFLSFEGLAEGANTYVHALFNSLSSSRYFLRSRIKCQLREGAPRQVIATEVHQNLKEKATGCVTHVQFIKCKKKKVFSVKAALFYSCECKNPSKPTTVKNAKLKCQKIAVVNFYIIFCQSHRKPQGASGEGRKSRVWPRGLRC